MNLAKLNFRLQLYQTKKKILIDRESIFRHTLGLDKINYTVHSESTQTPSLFPHFVMLQPYSYFGLCAECRCTAPFCCSQPIDRD